VNAVISRRTLLLGAGALTLAGCAVPRGAPSRAEVVAGAGTPEAGFALEVVTRERLALYPTWGRDAHARTGWPAPAGIPMEQRIAAGDTLNLRIWDAEERSLVSDDGARSADVSEVTVTGTGNVALPFIEPVPVAGLSAEGARQRLQDALREAVPSAQVQLSIRQGRRNSVDLVGGVANPGTYPLSERNLALTSLISSGGGVSESLINPQVQITRGGHVYRRPLRHVLDKPANDPAIIGGDRIVIESDPRSFTALGAAQREEVIGFDAETVSALRALSLMGGLADTRADPRGILVLRRYSSTAQGAPDTRVVFSFDLTRADGMFSADEFALQDGDIVMATQAPATTAQRVLMLFGAVLGTGQAVSNL